MPMTSPKLDRAQPRLCRLGAKFRRQRFDEILAEDFYCSTPTVAGRPRAFLKQTAIPLTISNLEAHDVKID